MPNHKQRWQILGGGTGITPPAPTPFSNTYSLDFDDIDDYVNCGNGDNFQFTTAITISAWVKPDAIDTSGGIIDKYDTVPFSGWSIWQSSAGPGRWKGTFGIEEPSNPGVYIQTEVEFDIPSTDWQFVVVTFDTVTGDLKLYHNGSLKDTDFNEALSTINTNLEEIILGARSDSPATEFGGNIDEVAIWDTVLDGATVASIYNLGAPNDLALSASYTAGSGVDKSGDLKAWWRMGDSGTYFNGNWEIPEQTKIDNWSSHSMEFDGVNDYIDISGVASEMDGAPWGTLSVWVRPAVATPTTNDRILHFGDSSSPAYIALYCENTGKLKADCRDNTGTYQWRCRSMVTPIFTAGEWAHIALVHNGITPALYINGVVVLLQFQVSTDITVWFDSLGSSVDEASIGADITAPSLFYEGNIDEVSIFDEVKTPFNLWNNGTPLDLSTESGLQGYWRMGESSNWNGTNWQLPDYSKNTLFSQKSLAFDGVDDYVDCGHVDALISATTFTISVWFKLDDAVGGYDMIVSQSQLAGRVNIWHQPGELGFQVMDSAICYFTINFTSNDWTHVAMVFDGSQGGLIPGPPYYQPGLQCYLNGSKITTFTDGFGIVPAVSAALTNSLLIGKYEIAAGYELGGNVDELSIWSTALSDANISTLYNSGKPSDLTTALGSTPVNWWLMGEDATWNTANWWLPNVVSTLFSKKSFDFKSGGFANYITMGNVLDKDGTEAFSISAWVRYTSGSSIAIVAKNDSGTPSGYALFSQAVGGINWYPATSAGGYIQVKSTNGVNDGNWHHVLATYDGSGNASGAKIYVDGSLDTTIVIDTATGSSSNSTDLQIGARDGPGLPFLGSIDDVAIFNSDKSASASHLYNGGTPADLSAESGLEGYWTFDDATFSTNWNVPDNSSNSNNGTSVNCDESCLEQDSPNSTAGKSSGMDEVDLEFNTPTNLSAGLSSGMAIDDKVNNAPDNINQGLSSGMTESDKVEDTPP